jgi:hypothetical protein
VVELIGSNYIAREPKKAKLFSLVVAAVPLPWAGRVENEESRFALGLMKTLPTEPEVP